jgi:UDP-N-acetylmuramate dehydrogenase
MLFRLLAIPNLHVFVNASLARYTRFEIGGPARALLDADDETALVSAWRVLDESGWRRTVIGGGTNLLVADQGFAGAVLRFTAKHIGFDGGVARVEAGALLQDLVDSTIVRGLRGLETMTGIPGWVGGAIYGNAGAYGRSMNEIVESVRYFDGAAIREIDNAGCDFAYRESAFKRHKDWIILSAALRLEPGDPEKLQASADGILKIRNEKYPPTMRCAGSIFKNLLLANLPESAQAIVPGSVIREGKVPSAYFLEQVGAKGMSNGAIRVADYHANLIYNTGGGTAHQVRAITTELKARVRAQFGIAIEEEVQFVGDSDAYWLVVEKSLA